MKLYYTITEASELLEVSRHMVNKAVCYLGIRYSPKKKLRIHIEDLDKIETLFESKDKSNPMRS